jgi:uncharacterized RDD family membrane protein YckC
LSADDEVQAAPTVGASLTRPTDVERPERASAAVIESEGGLEFRPAFASFPARAVGIVVDVVVLAVLELPAIAVLAFTSGVVVVVGVVLALAGFVLATAIYARAVAATGQSFGNRVASTRVVDVRNGRTVTVAAAATRYVIRMLISPILLIGFAMALFTADRRTLQDQFAGTVVVRPPRASWSIDDDPTTARPLG